jgi:beta-galactosidase
LSGLACAATTEIKIGADRQIKITQDWRFLKGDAEGAEQVSFNDSAWRQLDLPHDWAIEGPFDRKFDPHNGGLPYFGIGWYRKHFVLPASSRGRHIEAQFDGAMSNSTVWLNGQRVGGRPYGYSSFVVDLTPHLKFGEENVLAVRLAPEENSSRWYAGAGIYRNVWLIVSGTARVADWGTYVTTPEVTDAKAKVIVRTQLENRGSNAAKVTLETTILDAAGKQVARSTTPTDVNLVPGAKPTLEMTIEVANPHRWDLETPYLYSVVSTVREGGKQSDRYVTPIGIRTIEYTKDRGFLLNGKPHKFQGVCDHADLGALGSAINRRGLERQIEILKAFGTNAIRTSHNPPAPELLDLADRMGMLVMDEAFDMWVRPKKPNGYSKYWNEWYETDLRDFLHRDRNHPSVVMWSIGNEIPEQGRPEGPVIAKKLTEICHQEDPTRPTTSAFNNAAAAIRTGMADQVDVVGLNYRIREYAGFIKEHPNWLWVSTETSSGVSSRGVYHLPIEKYEKHPSLNLTSYDVIAPQWAYITDAEWDAQEKNPQIMGEFVWTGFDYLGEPTPYFNGRGQDRDADWPSRSSYFGIVDLAGFPKDRFYLYQSHWTTKPMVHILPHWNWAGMEGKPIPVMAYSNADEVELFLNGKSLGRKKRFSEPVELPVGTSVNADKKMMSKYRLLWQVPYEPGTLKAVAYQGGKPVATQETRTAGAPARIVITPDHTSITADGEDLSFVTVRLEDKDGNFCPMADNLVTFKLEGPGKIAGVDNGNPATEEPFQADHRKAFNGLALLIVRSEAGKPGKVKIMASADGLKSGETTVMTEAKK